MNGSLSPWLALGAFIAVTFGVSAIGGFVTQPSLPGWYAALKKPSWNPPNWLFGPVWSLLFLAMAVAAWMVWQRVGWASIPQSGSTRPLVLYAVQLVLNVLWSVLFFGLRSPGLALVEVVVFWFAIAATLVSFWLVSPLAGALLVPYLLWVTFASVLNAAIWRLNR